MTSVMTRLPVSQQQLECFNIPASLPFLENSLKRVPLILLTSADPEGTRAEGKLQRERGEKERERVRRRQSNVREKDSEKQNKKSEIEM